ncbi:hypothetical protein KR009_004071 [Drosophila setifemur]|nr:hypothetical protein KR009_004071 [Drosophila setifemur]
MPSSAINKTARSVANAIQLLAIVLYCCCLVRGQQHEKHQQQQQQQQHQQQQQQQQQQHLKYQQLQYQMQQQYEYQQQQHYQQQFQQQQQQQQQQHQLTPTATLGQQQHDESMDLLSTQPTQLLQTGVSLIVDDGKDSGDGSGSGSGLGSSSSVSGGMSSRRRTGQLGNRKRKRRPQLPLATMGATEEDGGAESGSAYWRGHVEDDAEALRRRKQPIGVREPMAALERDRDRDREKQRQRVEPTVLDATPQSSNANKAYRRPYGQAKKEAALVESPPSPGATRTAVDLKNILKNSGGLSLSEILQQKNLSLDDLLKGKQNALLALQTTAVAPAPASSSASASSFPSGESAKKQPNNKQGVRRLPAAYTTSNHNNDEESLGGQKTKSKVPTALQRLKLFGSSSREGSTTRRQSGSTTPAPALSSSSSPGSSTTRLPLYKKRQYLRSTLKPPGLFKGYGTTSTSTISTPVTTTTEEVETSTAFSTSTTMVYTPEEEQEKEQEVEQNAENSEEQELEQEEERDQELEQERERDQEQKRVDSSEAESGERNLHTEAPLPAPVATPTSSSSGNPRYRLRNSSIKENTKRFKDNFIGNLVESGEMEMVDLGDNASSSTTTEAPPSPSPPPPSEANRSSGEELNYGEDELENFFDEVESHTHHTRVPAPAPPPNPFRIPPAAAPPPSAAASPPSPPPLPSSSFSSSSSNPSKPAQLNLIIDDVDDRTDLLELIEDRRSGNRLFKVLEQRNMTLEELIEHRKRGSSQLHLSTIVSGDENSRLYPGQKVILQDNMDIVTAFENFPHFNLMDLKSVKPDEIKTDSQGSSYFTSIIDIEPNDDDVGVRGSVGSGNYAQTAVSSSSSAGGTITINQRGEKSLGFFPSWKTLALASLATATEERNPYFLPPPRLLLDGGSQEQDKEQERERDSNPEMDADREPPTSIDIDLSVSPYGSGNSSGLDNAHRLLPPINDDVIDEIENEVARAHDLLDLELSGPGFHRSPAAAAATSAVSQQHLSSLYANMPSGIRSALVASTAIVVTALATFLVVFVVCRWRQQRRRKSSYLRTYNAMKSKLPQQMHQRSTSSSVSATASMRQHMEELAVVGPGGGAGQGLGSGKSRSGEPGIASISTSVSCCSPAVHQLQRQSSLLLSTATSLTTTSASSGGGVPAPAKTTSSSAGAAAAFGHPDAAIGGRGLAISLRNAHQRLNTMDPNSPEVQEYLFDTLRKSFDN